MRPRPTASISLDADNLWSYLKTHGDSAWQSRPSYLPALTERLLSVWGENSVTGTVFVVGFDAERDGAELVARAHAAGHEVGNHSYEHEPWLHRYERDELALELSKTEQAIVQAGAPRPLGFRGPGYSLSPALLQLLADRGYHYDATLLPTWIGPLARAFYLRSTGIDTNERSKRVALFGSARDGLRPNRPFLWDVGPAGLVELPVTVFPGLRVPFHTSYVLQLYGISPRLAFTYLDVALEACLRSGREPSILMHPLDLLDGRDAPGLEFFPGMSLSADHKLRVVRRLLARLRRDFDLVGTCEHAHRVDRGRLRRRDIDTAGPRPRA